jgi:hypothetical protein
MIKHSSFLKSQLICKKYTWVRALPSKFLTDWTEFQCRRGTEYGGSFMFRKSIIFYFLVLHLTNRQQFRPKSWHLWYLRNLYFIVLYYLIKYSILLYYNRNTVILILVVLRISNVAQETACFYRNRMFIAVVTRARHCHVLHPMLSEREI